MASRAAAEPQSRPEPGQILIVIHDFSARSADELTLAKGDRVELIERDDDFGDGWYLGRHLTNGNSGLFPEVYTRIAPRGPPSYPQITTSLQSPPIAPESEKVQDAEPLTSILHEESVLLPPTPTTPVHVAEEDRTPQGSRHVSTSEILPTQPPPLSSAVIPQELEAEPASATTIVPEPTMQLKSLTTAVKASAHGQDSPVMNETLNVIDEHITDMNSPHHSMAGTDRRVGNDSGSEYSSHAEQRLSYINGEETDEEEDQPHTRREVESWTPDQVAEYLFTSGVEPKQCEVFRDQEITGDVLLEMDQTSVFVKEFELGSVGKRLKTWQKIKQLQEEIKGEAPTRRNAGSHAGSLPGSHVGSDLGSEDFSRRSQSINSTTMLPRIPSINERPGQFQNSRLSQTHTMRNELTQPPPTISRTIQETSRPPGDKRRPSAADIRDLHHSRQSSANEFSTTSLMSTLTGNSQGGALTVERQDGSHRKHPSFDRNWTMGSAASPSLHGPTPSLSLQNRPVSSGGMKSLSTSSTDPLAQFVTSTAPFDPLDRGYFSGGEAEGRSRNVLRKRGSTTTAAHSRNSSYAEEQRLRSATANHRHSRFGSVDSIQSSAPPSAAAKYYGLTLSGRRRTPSENSITGVPRPMPPPKDLPSPTVTKLEGAPYENATLPKSQDAKSWLSPVKSASNRHFGLRAISDAVTGHEKKMLISPTESNLSSTKESPLQSPSRTGSSTPSAGPSFDLDSPDAKPASPSMTNPGSAREKPVSKRKSKKETSAYTRGLEKKTPKEQMKDADYTGWMKKKSTNLMATWKPRLFILKGRRLSYYYSENDTEEKGLIDISFHRVLPADNERLTGLHATLTGATHSPTSPSGAQTTIAAAEAAAEPASSISEGKESIFIFKLVPPRAGLSKAVNFTKPTVHYFAVPNITVGRLWMAALMKATIDRDETIKPKSTYQQKTISLAKARAMRHRPPALMNLDEKIDEEALKSDEEESNGLQITGLNFDREPQEGDSGVSGVSRRENAQPTSASLNTNGAEKHSEPRSA